MKSFVALALLMVTLPVLAGCGSKPQPAEPPKQLMEPQKGWPKPSGGGKAPAQMNQISLPIPMVA